MATVITCHCCKKIRLQSEISEWTGKFKNGKNKWCGDHSCNDDDAHEECYQQKNAVHVSAVLLLVVKIVKNMKTML